MYFKILKMPINTCQEVSKSQVNNISNKLNHRLSKSKIYNFILISKTIHNGENII